MGRSSALLLVALACAVAVAASTVPLFSTVAVFGPNAAALEAPSASAGPVPFAQAVAAAAAAASGKTLYVALPARLLAPHRAHLTLAPLQEKAAASGAISYVAAPVASQVLLVVRRETVVHRTGGGTDSHTQHSAPEQGAEKVEAVLARSGAAAAAAWDVTEFDSVVVVAAGAEDGAAYPGTDPWWQPAVLMSIIALGSLMVPFFCFLYMATSIVRKAERERGRDGETELTCPF